ncbi:FAD-dependent monooxygenase [Streptomyces lavenduligriseus]|uniref:FAD-dependent monooxygenase n=1 Tax=Streptomyces lavenduligriseus TaxID=67315 RepID=A0ABT0P4P0_9ACTN|nr:FAD-dependent monooxygenase [Streptomyces lavenduligriseus]MCL3998690.1 FAD-dependent monooxygenase [Streptomyces lavenduligriseus]
MTTTEYDYDVVVAGAGPVGLFLACELRLGGARVLVLERRTEVDETIKAGSVNIATAIALYRRGLLPELAAAWEASRARLRAFGGNDGHATGGTAGRTPGKTDGRAPGGPSGLPPKFAGHFAGIMLDPDLFDGSDPAWADAGPAADAGLVIPQAELERILGRWADRLGVEVRRGVELTGFDAEADGVTVRTHTDSAGGGPRSLRAGRLVGCDGGRSTVRKLAGFDFPGTAPEITGYQALVRLAGAERLGSGWQTTGTGTYVHGPFPGRVLTVEFDGPPADRSAPVTAEELTASLRRVSGVPEVTVTEVLTATRFTDNARQATDYRRGRVLLAGDAAHVHAPFGGQGLNLGIGDALNLGWKLAAVARGRAPESLLDTYTAERHPVGARVLDWTRAQVALMRPDRHSRALRRVVTDLALTTAGTTYLATRISGVRQRYDLPGDHPLTGVCAPDLRLADGTRLGERLHTGRALLLDPAGDAGLRARAGGYGDRLDVVTAACPGRPGLRGLFVRPDGFVAWASDTAGGEGLPAALERWLGTPRVAA